MKTRRNRIDAIPDCFDPADLREIERLCRIAAKLSVRVISTRRWPESLSQVHCAGMFVPAGVVKRGHRQAIRTLLKFFHTPKPPRSCCAARACHTS